ncbi:F-box domain-containing protein [Artemisia annua]|uniref:F-box domain-containing protein n=1 Tax=Artemisia annua TaxID=35608 RepID=A0A2U1KRH0_ARTAN|nr:F-box domain-containing protein [Artemisia annua]
MTRKQKRLKTSEDGGSASWSDLFRDLLIIVMMRLGLVDLSHSVASAKGGGQLHILNGRHSWGANVPILDMQLFKGKIYSLNILTDLWEVKLEPEPTFVLIRINNFTMPKTDQIEFVSSGKNLYVVGWVTKSLYKVLEVNFDTMEWENPEKIVGQYTFYFSGMCTSSAAATAIKQNTQACGRGRTQSNIICFRSADQIKKRVGCVL